MRMIKLESVNDTGMAQLELARMNRLYSMLSQINRTIIRIEEAQAIYEAACRIAVECGGFDLSWVALIEPGSGRTVPMAAAGASSIAELRDFAGELSGFMPMDFVRSDEQPLVFNEISNDPRMASCRGVAERWGIHSGGVFPLKLEGAIVGTFCVMSILPGFFREAEISLLVEVADDLSFALDVIRREEKRVTTETRMRYLAFYDSQTGMPGRTLFEERLAEICQDAEGRTVAVLVVNLRRYHGILQLLGNGAGQKIIRTMATRLESVLSDLPVARVTESKFAVALQDPDGLDVVEELAWKMAHVLAEGALADGQEVFLDPFVGISVFPRDGKAPDLLRFAMQAAAAVDHDAGSLCRFFQADMNGSSRLRLSLDAALHRALENGEFKLHYQPQVDLASGRVIGAEALLRWQHPEQGLVSPLDFIPLLEENGLIVEVGEWVLLERAGAADSGKPRVCRPSGLRSIFLRGSFAMGTSKPWCGGCSIQPDSIQNCWSWRSPRVSCCTIPMHHSHPARTQCAGRDPRRWMTSGRVIRPSATCSACPLRASRLIAPLSPILRPAKATRRSSAQW